MARTGGGRIMKVKLKRHSAVKVQAYVDGVSYGHFSQDPDGNWTPSAFMRCKVHHVDHPSFPDVTVARRWLRNLVNGLAKYPRKEN